MRRIFDFYLGFLSISQPLKGWDIDSNGTTVYDPSNKDTFIIPLSETKGDYLFIDYDFSTSATFANSKIFFYDSSQKVLSSYNLYTHNFTEINVPSNAKYYAIKFPNIQDIFDKAKESKLVYFRKKVQPYYKDLQKKWAKESGQEFYRESLEGDIKLVGDDFEIIAQEPITTLFTLFIFKRPTSAPYFKGTFTKTDCSLNYSKKTCVPSIKTSDAYTDILNKYKDTHDLIKLGVPSEIITFSKRPFVQIYCAGANSVTNVFEGQAWESEVSVAVDNDLEIVNAGFTKLQSFREIYVENARQSKANGIYWRYEYQGVTETTWIEYHRWYKDDGAYIEQYKGYNGDSGITVYDSSNNPMYSGSLTDVWPSEMFGPGGSLIGMALSNPNDSADVFFITTDFLYKLFARIIHADVNRGADIKSNDFALSNLSYKRVTSMEYDSLTFKQSTDTTTEQTKYGVNDYGQYFTNANLPTPSGFYLPICRSSWVNSSLWLDFDNNFNVIDLQYSATQGLRDAHSIGHVIKVLLAKVAPSIKHEPTKDYSQFLYGTMPLSGISRFFVYITQKTNMILGTYDQAAQKAETTLEEILNMLRDCFRCYWYIEDNKLKIEHISFFIKGRTYSAIPVSVDLTNKKDIFNKKPILLGQSSLKYDKSDLARRYEFSGEGSDAFSKITLETNSVYITEDKVEKIELSNFNADISYMQIMASEVSKDGFALLCPIRPSGTDSFFDGLQVLKGDIELKDDKGNRKVVKAVNALASWAYLTKLYSYDMPSSSFTSDELWSFTVNGLKECLTQEIQIPYISELLPYMTVLTDMGTARIVEVSESLNTGFLKLKLIYPLR